MVEQVEQSPAGRYDRARVSSAEPLGIELRDAAYVCTLLHHAEELRKIHYFVVTSWTGAIVPDEAESVVWLGLDAPQGLDLEIDRTAVSEYLRLQREGD